MLYRKNTKNGKLLSQLGFGCMRLPHKGLSIDIKRSADMIHSAIDNGVNYFDTAYIYPGSESALGEILNGEWRPKINIATKLPVIFTRSAKDFDKFFEKQLERLKTDYIDYYLMHMLTDIDSWKKLQSFGIEEWIEKQKKNGRIRNIGFSFHGREESFRSIIDSYDWEFCMIQYNYLDEKYQAGTSGLKYASQKGLPIIAMEPLRGGKLANGLPKPAADIFKEANPDRSYAEWGIRWVLDHPEITVLLSGMSTEDQVNENIRIASEAQSSTLTSDELKAYEKVLTVMRKIIKTNCTGCGYCLPCPCGVDIPNCFSQYNETSVQNRFNVIIRHMIAAGVSCAKPSFASQCKKCGKCETHCPQNIKIMENLEKLSKEIEPFWIKPVAKIARYIASGKERA